MNNCESCRFCWRDYSVGDRECTCEHLTEEETDKYYADMEDNCPHYKPEEVIEYEY